MRSRTAEIAGGGIAGLSAGVALARKGWQVRIHEQDDQLRILGTGIYIWENGLRVLDTLGALDGTIKDCIPAWRSQKRDKQDRPFTQAYFARGNRLYVPLRESLLTILRDKAMEAAAEIVFGSRPVAAKPEGHLVFADGKTASADLVIGADGINSSIRDSLDLLALRKSANQFGYRTMIERAPEELSMPERRGHCEYWNGSSRILYAPCTAERAYVQLTSVRGDQQGNTMPPNRNYWLERFPQLKWLIERLPEDGRGDWFELLKLKRWSKGCVAIVGDAAIAQPLFLGQGGGCSMMAALSLAEALSGNGKIECALGAWERRERPLLETTQNIAYWTGQLASAPEIVRINAFRALYSIGWLRRRTIAVAAAHRPTGTELTPA